MEPEERDLFQNKLNQIDQVRLSFSLLNVYSSIQLISRGLSEVTWKSLHLSDYIEESDGLITRQVSLALEVVQRHVATIRDIAFQWAQFPSDIFQEQSHLTFQQAIDKHQSALLSLSLLFSPFSSIRRL